jgi:hypothetical protein
MQCKRDQFWDHYKQTLEPSWYLLVDVNMLVGANNFGPLLMT